MFHFKITCETVWRWHPWSRIGKRPSTSLQKCSPPPWWSGDATSRVLCTRDEYVQPPHARVKEEFCFKQWWEKKKTSLMWQCKIWVVVKHLILLVLLVSLHLSTETSLGTCYGRRLFIFLQWRIPPLWHLMPIWDFLLEDLKEKQQTFRILKKIVNLSLYKIENLRQTSSNYKEIINYDILYIWSETSV